MIEIYQSPFNDMPKSMLDAARKYEQQFNVHFATLSWFPHALLNTLQESSGVNEAPREAVIASHHNADAAEDINVLTTVANTSTLDTSLREAYRESMENLFRSLPDQPSKSSERPDILSVAPGREGIILATRLGYLGSTNRLTPDAKRIHCYDGLLIGLSELPPIHSYSECLLIDGAIATGTTLISLIAQLRNNVTSFRVYAAHSTIAGLWALANYTRNEGIKLSCFVGHASGTLNDKYYAIEPSSGGLVIGDVGDTIAPLSEVAP